MPTATGHTKAIRASRVIGANVYSASRERIGEVEDVVLDKTSNEIMFAVISIGGAMTATDNYYPLPWSVLDYDEELGGYLVPSSRDDFATGPAVSKLSELTRDDGERTRAAVEAHYKAQ